MHPKFTPFILKWYHQNGRSLPWRETHDAYRIWVSEIILQQTRVEQGRAYYERFIERFPSVKELAEASEDEVLHLWQGLGYYSRARNMHTAAQQVMSLGGQFPTKFVELRKLKGVGEYTAAAIASFAFDEPCAVVDGNVYRVLSRFMGEETPIDSTTGRRLFAELAIEMMDSSQPALYNQAIMDFGALQCTPHIPNCDTCPLKETCAAYAANIVDRLPIKAHRTCITDRYLTYICVRDTQGRILLQRRENNDIWRGLYQFFLIEKSQALTPTEVKASLPLGELTLLTKNHIHQLSHQRLHTDFYHLKLAKDTPSLTGFWAKPSELEHYALPRLLTLLWESHSQFLTF